jgi:hypothetical protein
MPEEFAVPAEIDAVIRDFDERETLFTEHNVQFALANTRKQIASSSKPGNIGDWADVLAFALYPSSLNNPWDTHFGPMGSEVDAQGKVYYFPDIALATPNVIVHWQRRAGEAKNPLLRARYADLVWDFDRELASRSNDGTNCYRRLFADG